MIERRHPHPHIDPRQPKADHAPAVNPPVFVWKTEREAQTTGIRIARDEAMQDICLEENKLDTPVFLPAQAFAPGRYFWQWCEGDDSSEIFEFRIERSALLLEVPLVDEWLNHIPTAHPRLYVLRQELEELRDSRSTVRADGWQELKGTADEIMLEPHQMAEPPYKPDRQRDFEAYSVANKQIMWGSRRFMTGAETLALAYLASGERKYAAAARSRVLSVTEWARKARHIWLTMTRPICRSSIMGRG